MRPLASARAIVTDLVSPPDWTVRRCIMGIGHGASSPRPGRARPEPSRQAPCSRLQLRYADGRRRDIRSPWPTPRCACTSTIADGHFATRSSLEPGEIPAFRFDAMRSLAPDAAGVIAAIRLRSRSIQLRNNRRGAGFRNGEIRDALPSESLAEMLVRGTETSEGRGIQTESAKRFTLGLAPRLPFLPCDGDDLIHSPPPS